MVELEFEVEVKEKHYHSGELVAIPGNRYKAERFFIGDMLRVYGEFSTYIIFLDNDNYIVYGKGVKRIGKNE